jgi:hypothetical protein
MESIIIFLYACAPIISTCGYLPQVVKIIRSTPAELKGISIRAWMLWLTNSIIAFLYGLVHLHDPLFLVVTGIGLFWVGLVLGLTVAKQRQPALSPGCA